MQFTHPSYSMVFMMNPSVGLTVLTSSFISFLTIVVLPALSRPLRWHQQSWLNIYVRPQTASIFSFLYPLIGLCAILKALYLRHLFSMDSKCCFRQFGIFLKVGSGLLLLLSQMFRFIRPIHRAFLPHGISPQFINFF